MRSTANALQCILGAAILQACVAHAGFRPGSQEWIVVLLLLSPLLLMPMARSLLEKDDPIGHLALEFACALLLVFALFADEHAAWAAILTLPWLALRAWVAWSAWMRWRRDMQWQGGDLCLEAARVFPMVGAMWLLAWTAGWMPFGFDPLIVLLTGAHFHHAGFTLPLIAGLAAKHRPSFLSINACRLILAGVPLVAAGITCTHFRVALWVEPVAVMVLIAGALALGLVQIRIAVDARLPGSARVCLAIAGLCLLAAMLLAAGFGLRIWFPSLALPMDRMWAVHGTLNALGFGAFGITGWLLIARHRPASALPA